MTVQGDESRAEVTPLPGSFRSPQDRRMNFVLEAETCQKSLHAASS